MQFAYDDNGKRINPSFSGQRAKCPLCEGMVIAKCGDVYTHHWSHQQSCSCDSWHEPETLWHLLWKERFPEAWREVVIDRNGKRHIADILTATGTVIEFQNSAISNATISIREEFYKDMIWVINAKPFKHNLRLQSVVNRRLRELEQSYCQDRITYNSDCDGEVKEIDIDIRKNSDAQWSKKQELASRERLLKKLKETLADFDAFVEKGISQAYFWDYDLSEVTKNVSVYLRDGISGITTKRKDLLRDKSEKETSLAGITSLKDFEYNGEKWKVTEFNRVNKSNFKWVKALSVESTRTMFPEILSIQSETEYEVYERFRKDSYKLLFNPANPVANLNRALSEIQTQLENLTNEEDALRSKVKEELLNNLHTMISVVGKEVEALEGDYIQLLADAAYLEQRRDRHIDEMEKDKFEFAATQEKEKKEKRIKIMVDKKGMYWYQWKHKRRSWEDARADVYFDIGEDYLLYKSSDTILRKISIVDFLNRYLVLANHDNNSL
jgi:hypothetical protein